MWSLAQVAVVLWCLGYPEQALQKSREALCLAHKLGHPFSTGWVLICAAWLHQLRQEPQEAQGQAEAAITLSTDQGFPLWLAHGTVQGGWALAQQGQGEEGIAQMRQGMAAYRATGAELIRPCQLALLAEAYGKAGQTEEGLTALAEALDLVQKTGEHMWEAERYRLKGELTLQQFKVQSSELPIPDPRPLTPKPKPKHVFSRRLRLPAVSRPSRWSCGQ